MEVNPYQAPSAQNFPASLAANVEAAQVRQIYLKHEASVKGVGTLHILGAVFFLFAAFIMGAADSPPGQGSGAAAAVVGGGIVWLLVAALLIATGVGVRGLRPWARILSMILSGIGLLLSLAGLLVPPHVAGVIPLVINLYFILTMATPKGSMVFSDYYKGIIAQTPGMKYRTGKAVWILLAVIIVLIGCAVMFTL